MDLGFYTGTPSYYQIKYRLYNILETYDCNNDTSNTLSILEYIDKSEFEQVIGESITDQMV